MKMELKKPAGEEEKMIKPLYLQEVVPGKWKAQGICLWCESATCEKQKTMSNPVCSVLFTSLTVY